MFVETKNKWKVATVELDEWQYGKGFGAGKEDEGKNGFAFYELENKIENENGKKKISLDFITSQICAKPVLTAVTESQFKVWQNAVIIAIPAVFHWK